MSMTRRDRKQTKLSMILLEDMVPDNHLLRKVDKAIDLSFIYDYLEDKYSQIGRPSIDPVILFKLALVDKLYNYRSMRRTCEEAKVNLAIRWYLGIDLEDPVPHFSDFSKNYTRKFKHSIDIIDDNGEVVETKTIFELIFERILEEAMRHNFLYPAHTYMDSTHIKANANKKKVDKKEVVRELRDYQEELDKEIDSECEAKGYNIPKALEPETVVATVSTTDPECGVFMKGEHEKQLAYLAQTACDANGFVLGCTVTAANLHDSTTFLGLYNEITDRYSIEKLGTKGIRSLGLDAGYKTPAIAHTIINDGITPLMPYTSPKGKKNNEENPTKMGKKEFRYDKSADVFLCKNGCPLTPRGISRKSGYITYRSNKKDCDSCPFRDQCLTKSSTTKTLVRHIWQDDLDEVELIRHTEYHERYYRLRSLTIERVFADAKEKFGLRYTRHRGKQRVFHETLFIFACMNLKKMALWLSPSV